MKIWETIEKIVSLYTQFIRPSYCAGSHYEELKLLQLYFVDVSLLSEPGVFMEICSFHMFQQFLLNQDFVHPTLKSLLQDIFFEKQTTVPDAAAPVSAGVAAAASFELPPSPFADLPPRRHWSTASSYHAPPSFSPRRCRSRYESAEGRSRELSALRAMAVLFLSPPPPMPASWGYDPVLLWQWVARRLEARPRYFHCWSCWWGHYRTERMKARP